MNDLAREVLVRAGMDRVSQIKGSYMDGLGGLCAIGVLATYLDFKPMTEKIIGAGWRDAAILKYNLTSEEENQVVRLNDAGVDFIGIARKVGMDHGPDS